MLPESIQKFIENFSKLPAVGPRMATRLAFYLVDLSEQSFKNLNEALLGLKNIDTCPHCFFIKDVGQKLCRICSDPERSEEVKVIIEKYTDLLSIEKSGAFNGTYLVIGESNGRGMLESEQKLRLNQFKNTVQKRSGGKLAEIIIAVSPTSHGDFLAQTLQKNLQDSAERITRLGRGIPTGAEIEFTDEETLENAFRGRT